MTTAELTDVIVTSVKAATGPLLVRIAALETRLAAIETAPKTLDYQGVWQRAIFYQRNQAATHKGSLWVCLMDARGHEPGTAPACWQLAQKEDAR